MDQDRYDRGWAMLQRVSGGAGQSIVESLEDIAPELGRYIVEFAYGDVYTRPVLDLRVRQIATIAALTSMGNAQPQLKVHVQAALNVGCTREEIIETMMHVAVFAGFPAALNAVFAAREVFTQATWKAGQPSRAGSTPRSQLRNQACHRTAAIGPAAAAGRRTKTVVPSGPVCSTWIVPTFAVTRSRAIVSPIPLPARSPPRLRSAR